jgi:hypothetical protein
MTFLEIGRSKVLELLIQTILELTRTSFDSANVYIIIDKIDEYPKRETFYDSLRHLAISNIKILTIDRFERDIMKAFSKNPHLEISEKISAKNIEIHLKQNFKSNPKLKTIEAKL